MTAMTMAACSAEAARQAAEVKPETGGRVEGGGRGGGGGRSTGATIVGAGVTACGCGE